MSFKLKTIIGIAIIEIFLLTLLVLSALFYLKASNEQQFHERAQTAIKLLTTMTTDAVISYDLATLDALVKHAILNKDIKSVRILGRDGTLLAAAVNSNLLDASVSEVDTPVFVKNQINMSGPIILGNTNYGTIEVIIDTGSLQAIFMEAAKWMLLIAVFEVLLVVLFGYVLGSFLTKQLLEIKAGVKRIAGGEFGYQIGIRGNDEFAETALSFNLMSGSLAVLTRDLKQSLDNAVDRRHQAEAILHDAIASLSVGVLITDAKGDIIHLNSAFEKLHSQLFSIADARDLRTIDLAIARHIDCLVLGPASEDQLQSNDNDFDVVSPFNRFTFSNGDPEWTCKYENGKTVLYSSSIMGRGGNVFMATDVTSIHQTELAARLLKTELVQSQKFEAIGTLAGGIAHELNTPMQFVGDNLSFINRALIDLRSVIEQHISLLGNLSENTDVGDLTPMMDALEAADYEFLKEELPEAIEQSIDGVTQMANIVLAMNEFAHPSKKEVGDVDVHHALERASLLSRNEWKYLAEMDYQFYKESLVVPANESEINQVFLNIIVNAAHAIKAAARKEGRITLRTFRTEDKVIISIADNGTGIPEDIAQRVYDQFFTTKGVGQGTGQGLALCREFIVKRNGGKIYFESEQGIGTTFIIELPIVRNSEIKKSA